ncbi:MAG: gamma-glutamylcyclotransferase [Deltaproteobacteria bacterium]|jgi:gamma-glutamylcyclotransferase (GGCT)/AIG2-like uncharacterized protein YtfP|nr:gamma-glutamylcyclotransferase [Deltaproteobacteria bacterium]MBW2504926.1 gamma-glutamylcyclotransferase [Deltaproteobacteria bacterium]MBW2519911.1 gamma-glutamylcyclotransferase [Deltaproteobacteria bacterium]
MHSTLSLSEHLPLFVYGTLRPGGSNFARFLQEHAKRIQSASVSGQIYWHVEGDYPYLVNGPGRVTGHLIEIDPEVWPNLLAEIDRLEDYDMQNEAESWYVRRRITATLANGQRQTCWTYFWNRQCSGRLIEHGDWLKR